MKNNKSEIFDEGNENYNKIKIRDWKAIEFKLIKHDWKQLKVSLEIQIQNIYPGLVKNVVMLGR
jgi:hypothetical protein